MPTLHPHILKTQCIINSDSHINVFLQHAAILNKDKSLLHYIDACLTKTSKQLSFLWEGAGQGLWITL